jgi:hypothetical protein
MTGWSINAAELRIPRRSRVAAHRMIVIADPDGNAVRQINGLASWWDAAGKCWRHKPIGYLPSDRLRGYDTKAHPRTYMPINGAAPPRWNITAALETGAARTLAGGLSRDEAEQRLAPALLAMQRINALNEGPEGGAGVPYPFMGFGRNSNSFFHTLLMAMSFEPPRFANAAFIVPGARGLLLSANVLDEIRTPAAPSTASFSGVSRESRLAQPGKS